MVTADVGQFGSVASAGEAAGLVEDGRWSGGGGSGMGGGGIGGVASGGAMAVARAWGGRNHSCMVRAQSCPVCEKPLPPGTGDSALFPFCSVRCRQVDLYRWLTGRYTIVEPLDPERLEPEAEADWQKDGGQKDDEAELG